MTASLSAPPALLGADTNTDSASAIDYLRQLHRFLILKKRLDRSQTSARELMPIYWRRLIEVGVPIDIAKSIAWTIVRYEVAQLSPTAPQQQLLRRYCRFICRAGLWRSKLL